MNYIHITRIGDKEIINDFQNFDSKELSAVRMFLNQEQLEIKGFGEIDGKYQKEPINADDRMEPYDTIAEMEIENGFSDKPPVGLKARVGDYIDFVFGGIAFNGYVDEIVGGNSGREFIIKNHPHAVYEFTLRATEQMLIDVGFFKLEK